MDNFWWTYCGEGVCLINCWIFSQNIYYSIPYVQTVSRPKSSAGSHSVTHCVCKTVQYCKVPYKYRRRIKSSCPQSIDETQSVRGRKKTMALAEMAACSWQGRVRGEKRRFMVMLAQMETHPWLTTSNWKLTSRLTWKDFIRFLGFSMLEKSEKMCAAIHLDGNDPVLSVLWAKGHMCS